jgi:hypothetical protein
MSNIREKLKKIDDLMKQCLKEDRRIDDHRLAGDLYCQAMEEAKKIGPGMESIVRDVRFNGGRMPNYDDDY